MGISLVTAPVEYPVSLSEAKRHLRVDTSDEDELIDTLISAATETAQHFLRRQLVSATWKYTLDDWPEETINPPYPPLNSVTQIQYVDTDGNTQTLSNALYTVYTNVEPGAIERAWNCDWPSTRTVRDAVQVTYVAGYGLASAVPAPFRGAIKLLVGHLYEHREAVLELAPGARIAELPHAYKSLLWPYRILTV